MRHVDDTGGSHMRRSDALVPGLLGFVGAVEIVGGTHEPVWVGLGTYWLAAGALGVRRIAPLAVPPASAQSTR